MKYLKRFITYFLSFMLFHLAFDMIKAREFSFDVVDWGHDLTFSTIFSLFYTFVTVEFKKA